MNLPSVSILMATNKFDDYLIASIDSCLQQSHSNFELILVVNGVEDRDFIKIISYCIDKRITVLRTNIKKLTFSLNYGLNHCRSDLIARIDADDIAHPLRLAKQIDFMRSNPSISICGSNCDLIDSFGQKVGEWRFPETDVMIRKALYWKNPICHPSVILRKNVVENIGGYSSLYAEDYYLWANLSVDSEIRFANLQENLISYRADSPEHPRSLIKRRTKSSVAGIQMQLFAITGKVSWLFASILSLIKIILYAK